ncbi:MAG: hypothetical protein QOG63_2273 [Thermoleophilaceae bacterium]|jgi:transcriptional regulator with XRE-family HTH domain|nr:hypothetical protein [Thermoleophilaceae bacterium]
MNARRRTYVAALAGAAVLASGAYAIGSAQGGGSASAAASKAGRPHFAFAPGGPPPPGARVEFKRGPGGPPLAALAAKLGVSQKALRAALRGIGPQTHRVGGPSELAGALGVSEQKLGAAFEKVRQQEEADFPARLAAALGLDEADVKAALDKERSQHEDQEKGMRDEFAKALADRLNIPESKVRDALDSLPHPGPPPGPPGPPPGPPGPPYGP